MRRGAQSLEISGSKLLYKNHMPGTVDSTVDDIDAVFPSPKLKSSWGNRQVKSNYCTSMISIKMREM